MNRQTFPLEPVSETKFKIESAGIVFDFDPAKKQMLFSRGGKEKIFTKEN